MTPRCTPPQAATGPKKERPANAPTGISVHFAMRCSMLAITGSWPRRKNMPCGNGKQAWQQRRWRASRRSPTQRATGKQVGENK